MSVREQILLRLLHHTRRSIGEIQEEATRLAHALGLPGLPTGRPADCSPVDLQRAAWVRAFLGRPAMTLLEEPLSDEDFDALEPLLNTMRELRDHGTSILWMTRRERLWRDPSLPASRRLRMIGRRIEEVSGL